MAYHVTQANFNRRIKAVSAWSLQMTAGAVLSALRTLVDPVAVRFRELYGQRLLDEMRFPAPVPMREARTYDTRHTDLDGTHVG